MTDAILNVCLSVVLPGLMAIMGVVMSFRQSEDTPMSKKEQWWWIVAFLFVLSLNFPLAIWKETRTLKQQQAAEKKAEDAENRRISETQYMNGKLDTMAVVLSSISNRPSDFSGLARGLANFAKETPQQALARRRSETQAKLGELVGEGQQLYDGCFSRKEISDEFAAGVSDWLKRTRAVVAGNLKPEYLMNLEHSPLEREGVQGFCEGLSHSVGGLRAILWEEFAQERETRP